MTMQEVLALGAGVQSSTVLLMSIRGELPKIDHAIFSDTGWEPIEVYEWLEQLKPMMAEAGINFHLVSQGNIKEDALRSQVRGKAENGNRWASMPYFTQKTWTPDDIPQLLALIEEREDEDKDPVKYAEILQQLHRGEEVVQNGMIRRQCTYEYKIRPIEKCIKREVMGLAPRQRASKTPVVRQWFGISYDERERMRIPDDKWKVHWYPLVEQRHSRLWCLEWMEKNGFPEPPRSACIGCPFRHDREWRWLKVNAPHEFEEACVFDEAVRKCGGLRGDVFLHASRRPLRELDFRDDFDKGQLPLWDGFRNECEGMCGL